MNILLDTHTLLWFVDGSPQLGSNARKLIEDTKSNVYVSVATIWELGIKIGLGKLTIAQPLDGYITTQLAKNSMRILAIEPHHAWSVAALPLHHRDPFDRLLITQAMLERMPLLSGDSVFDNYGVTRYW